MLGAVVSDWRELLAFWFGNADETGLSVPDKRARWFASNPDFDSQCATAFGPLLAPAAGGNLDDWLESPLSRLAFIVLTDQIPRNIYRGRAEAFHWDSLALSAATEGVRRGADRQLSVDQRSFFYMPFEHSEEILDQYIATGLFTTLRDESPKPLRHITGNSLRFAQKHRNIILTYGRFPHRNAVLRRKSSLAEAKFVAESDGFGQAL